MAVALCAAFTPAAAQEEYGIFDYSDQMWVADDGESYFLNGIFNKVSPNGRYAVGYGLIYAYGLQDKIADSAGRIYWMEDPVQAIKGIINNGRYYIYTSKYVCFTLV